MNLFLYVGNYLKPGCLYTPLRITLFKPQNQSECDLTIRHIEDMRKNLRTNAKKKPISL